MSAGKWFVDSNRAPVDLAAVTAGGIVQVDVYELFVDAIGHERRPLWARAGTPVTVERVAAALREVSPGSPPSTTPRPPAPPSLPERVAALDQEVDTRVAAVESQLLPQHSRRTTGGTLTLAEAGAVVECESAIPMTLTVPPVGVVPFPNNTFIAVQQVGVGQVTLAPGPGVTLRAPAAGGLKTPAQYGQLVARLRPSRGGGLPTADLIMRFRADDVAGANGSPVASWPESSGLGHPPAVQPNPDNQPVITRGVLNGHAGVTFASVNDWLQMTGSALDVARGRSALTVYLVYQYPSTISGVRTAFALSSGASATANRLALQKDASGNLQVGGRRLDSNSPLYVSAGPMVSAEAAVAAGRFVYSGSDLHTLKNGAAAASNAAWHTNGASEDTRSLAGAIGSNANGTAEYWFGSICEILVYAADHDASARAAVHTYVQATYGIPVADFDGVANEWIVSGGVA